MKRSLRWLACSAIIAVAGCGPSDKGSPSASTPASSAAASAAPKKLRGTPAGAIDELLDDGTLLGSLETIATDKDKRFDPELRKKLTKPQR